MTYTNEDYEKYQHKFARDQFRLAFRGRNKQTKAQAKEAARVKACYEKQDYGGVK